MKLKEMIIHLRSRGYMIIPPSSKGGTQFNERAIIRALKEDHERYVYKGADGFYYIAFSGGLGSLFIQPETIKLMVENELLVDKHTERKGVYLVLQYDAYDKSTRKDGQ